MFDYNYNQLVTKTNINTGNNSNPLYYGSHIYSSVTNFEIEFNDFSQNNQPVASSVQKYAFTASATNIDLQATDVDGDNLNYTITTPPSNGTATITGNVLTYTSVAGFVGDDTIYYTANDGFADSNEHRFSLM